MRFLLCQLCLLVLVLNSISAQVNNSRSCERHCGNISIPYPFGIGQGCYLDEWYEVQCNNSVPFLRNSSKEVVQIDLPGALVHGIKSVAPGSLRIKTKIVSMGCNGVGDRKDVLDFTNSPFFISSNNKLVAFGCNRTTTLTHVEPRIVGCVSSCDLFILPKGLVYDECYGYRCCSASTPSDFLEEIGVKIDNDDDVSNTTTGRCAVAFLTDEFAQPRRPWNITTSPEWFHERQYSTIQLEWIIQTTNLSFGESLQCGTTNPEVPVTLDDFQSRPCYCDRLTLPYNNSDGLSYLMCACTYGYEGNPYEYDLHGCIDINECEIPEDGRPNPCNSDETCLNTLGGHHCLVKKNQTWPIYLGVSVGLGVLLIGLSFWLYKFVKRHRKLRLRRQLFKRNGGLLLQQQLTSREGRSVEKTVVFTSKEVGKATENFSPDRILGQGGQGTVYKGMLPDGRIVAVKKSKALDKDQVADFINEVVVLTQINHRRIVSILGCCLETEVPVLIYEYIPNGNVFEHLHGDVEDGHTAVSWELRLQIAKDTAHALGYLHSYVTCPIYHKDVKTANIMLDHKHRAKLADFGTSRVISVDDAHLTTPFVSGTPGYLDPEYHQSSRYTEKSDVYSYGVVLAELITGEEPFIPQPPQHPKTLSTSFLRAMKEKRLLDIIDPRIRDHCALEQVKVMAKIARLCLNLKGEKRPTMSNIIMELERIGSSHGDSQAHHILQTDDDDDDDEEQAVQVRESFNIDVASTSATQPVQVRESFNIDVASTSATQPLFPRQTC